MSTVRITLGHTANLGNFENVKVEVSVEDDQRAGETTKQTIDRVYKLVEAELVARVEKAVAELK